MTIQLGQQEYNLKRLADNLRDERDQWSEIKCRPGLVLRGAHLLHALWGDERPSLEHAATALRNHLSHPSLQGVKEDTEALWVWHGPGPMDEPLSVAMGLRHGRSDERLAGRRTRREYPRRADGLHLVLNAHLQIRQVPA